MKKVCFAVVLLIILLASITPVLADGMIVVHDKDMWRMFMEEQQYCAINYQEGIQHMLLTVDTTEDLMGDQAVWIFPVPASPEQTDINIIRGFPAFLGEDLEKETNNAFNKIMLGMSATQIYPLPFFILFYGVTSPSALLARGAGDVFLGGKGAEGVTVYESLEKYGLTTELISAVDEQALTDYIVSKDLALPGEMKSILEQYIGEDYAFVVSWISDVYEYKSAQLNFRSHPYYTGRTAGNTIGVFISFPTEKIFYPLKPTSVYGEKVIPAVIYVLGYATPELYDDIRELTEVDYFLSWRFTAPRELGDFFAGYKTTPVDYYSGPDEGTKPGFEIRDLKYTKIKIEAASNALTQDLWIEEKTPGKVIIYQSIIKRTFWWGLLIFIILSCLSSLIAGVIAFHANNPSIPKFFFFGLFNILTLIGVWVAAYWKDVEHTFTEHEQAVYQTVKLSIKQTASIATPLLILAVLILFIPISLLLQIDILYFPFIFSIFFIFLLFPILVFLPLILWGTYRHKKILMFNIVFSVTFLVLTILLRLLLGIII